MELILFECSDKSGRIMLCNVMRHLSSNSNDYELARSQILAVVVVAIILTDTFILSLSPE